MAPSVLSVGLNTAFALTTLSVPNAVPGDMPLTVAFMIADKTLSLVTSSGVPLASATRNGSFVPHGDTVAVYADWYGNGHFEEVDPTYWNVNADGSIDVKHYYDQNQPGDAPYQAKIRVEADGTSTDYSPAVNIWHVPPTADLVAGNARTTLSDQWDRKGERAYWIAPGEVVKFINISDPSLADSGMLTYWWRRKSKGTR